MLKESARVEPAIWEAAEGGFEVARWGSVMNALLLLSADHAETAVCHLTTADVATRAG